MKTFIVAIETPAGWTRLSETRYLDVNDAHASGWRYAVRHRLDASTVKVFPHVGTFRSRALRRDDWDAIAFFATLAAFVFILFCAVTYPAPACQIIAVDGSGNEFVAGSGSTYREAQRNAVLPNDWREIRFPGC